MHETTKRPRTFQGVALDQVGASPQVGSLDTHPIPVFLHIRFLQCQVHDADADVMNNFITDVQIDVQTDVRRDQVRDAGLRCQLEHCGIILVRSSRDDWILSFQSDVYVMSVLKVQIARSGSPRRQKPCRLPGSRALRSQLRRSNL